MTRRPEFVGFRLRKAALRTGALTGILISSVVVGWLWVANHMPQFQSYAVIRNIAGGALIVVLMLIPVFRFRRQPVTMFVSGLTAWTLLTGTYIAMEMQYSLLESRMGALQVFMLGAVSCGFVAVFEWVFQLCAETRQRHVSQVSEGALPVPPRRIP